MKNKHKCAGHNHLEQPTISTQNMTPMEIVTATDQAGSHVIISGERLEVRRLGHNKDLTVEQGVERWPTLREIKRKHIINVLRHVEGNRSRASEILGIDRVSLWRKLKKHEIASCPAPPADCTGLAPEASHE